MKKTKLTKEEQVIEAALEQGEYRDVDKSQFQQIAKAITSRRKDAVLNIRVNSEDLEKIKKKAERLGVRYQTLISEFLHRLAG